MSWPFVLSLVKRLDTIKPSIVSIKSRQVGAQQENLEQAY